MSTLVLDSLEIKNFRAFKHLRIEKLGRVNLIVGKNNVGKSSVLEGLLLYGRKGSLSAVWDILVARNERDFSVGLKLTVEDNVEALRYLFYGRQSVKERHSIAYVGPCDLKDDLFFIEVLWYATAYGGLGSLGGVDTPQPRVLTPDEARVANQATPYLGVGIGNQPTNVYSLAPETGFGASVSNGSSNKPCVFISAKGITPIQIGQLWDQIALRDSEVDVLQALCLIAPEVQRVNLVAGKDNYQQRKPIVKLLGTDEPIPLRSLGEGMNRMFGIALALVNAKDGMLLIDEVDTGLHYSVLPDMWKLIFEVAHRLNVQVFATSHSWDCIQAFQQAAADNQEAEGVLIRLEQRKDGIGAVTFDEGELAIVTREQIEVR